MADNKISDWEDVPVAEISDWEDVPTEKTSGLKSGLRGAAQGLSFGFADEIAGALESLVSDKTYEQARDESRALYKAAEEANPKTYMAGQVAGAVAPALLTGGGSTAATVGSLAAQGAAQGLGSSEADLTKGDILGAAKDVAIGGTIGAVTGKAGQLLSKVPVGRTFGKISDSLANAADDAAEKLAIKSTGATGAQSLKFAPGAGRELLDEGLVRFGDTAGDIAERVGKRHDLAGEAIESALKQLDDKGAVASVDNVVSALESQVDELSRTPGNEKIIRQIQNEIDNLYNRGQSNLPLSQGEVAKRNFQNQVNYFSPEAEKKAATHVARAFREEVEQSAQKVDPAISQLFQQEKKAFGMLSPIREAAEKRAAQQAQSPFGGLTDMITGATAGPKGLATKYGIEQIGQRTAASGAVMVDKLADIVRNSPQTFGKFAKVLQNAAQRGGTSLAATSFVLQQTDPEYRELYSKLNQQNEGR